MERTGTEKRPCKPSNNTTCIVLATLLSKTENKRVAPHCCFASAVRLSDAPRSIEERPFPHFPNINERWGTAKPGSEHVDDSIIRLPTSHSGPRSASSISVWRAVRLVRRSILDAHFLCLLGRKKARNRK